MNLEEWLEEEFKVGWFWLDLTETDIKSVCVGSWWPCCVDDVCFVFCKSSYLTWIFIFFFLMLLCLGFHIQVYDDGRVVLEFDWDLDMSIHVKREINGLWWWKMKMKVLGFWDFGGDKWWEDEYEDRRWRKHVISIFHMNFNTCTIEVMNLTSNHLSCKFFLCFNISKF